MVALAPSPTRTGKPHMRLPAGLHVLQFDRRGKLGALGDVEEIAVGHEGGVERADRIVGAMRIERRRKAAVGQLFGQRARTVTPSIAGAFADETPFSSGSTAEPSRTGATAFAFAVSSCGGTADSSRRRSV